MKIKFLGVGSAINTKQMGNSILLDDSILIDASPFVSNRLLACGIDVRSLEAIFITHMHADHYFGLPLLLTEFLLKKRDTPLRIYGPKGLKESVKTLMHLAFPESSTEKLLAASKSEFYEIEHGKTIGPIKTLMLTPIKVSHGSIETFGVIVNNPPIRIFFTSDTELFDGLNEILRDCQFCVADGTTYDMSVPGHTNYVQVLDLSRKNPQAWFFVTHRSEYPIVSSEHKLLFPVDLDTFELCSNKAPILISSAT